jgi:hypothetical protein
MTNNILTSQKITPKALVVFSHETDLPWLKILKPGFRHCFVILNDGQSWVSYDPLAHHTEIAVHDLPPSFDLPGWLEGRGHTVIKAEVNHDHKRPAPLMLFTCVEAVKRILGLYALFVLTPWQLFQALQRQQSQEHIYKEIPHGKFSIPA